MRSTALALALAALALAVPPSPLHGEPRLDDLEVDVDGNQVYVGCRLLGALDERFFERLDSGLPTGFTFHFELSRLSRYWFDRNLDSVTLQVVAMYDALEKEYLVNYKLGGELVDSRALRDLGELRRALTQIAARPLFSLDQIPARWRLRVRARVELGSRTLYSLIPSRVTTEWVESRRFRSANPLP